MNSKVDSQEKNKKGFKYYLIIGINIATILLVFFGFVCVLIPSLNLLSNESVFFYMVCTLILAALNFYIRSDHK